MKLLDYNPHNLKLSEVISLFSAYGLTARKKSYSKELRIYNERFKNRFHMFDYAYETGYITLISDIKKPIGRVKDIEDAAILISKVKIKRN